MGAAGQHEQHHKPQEGSGVTVKDTTTPNYPTITDDSGLQVYEDRSGDVFPRRCLTEEGLERRIHLFSLGLHGCPLLGARNGPICLDPVLKAVELPAGIAHLHASLPDVDGNAFPLEGEMACYKVIFIFLRHPVTLHQPPRFLFELFV